MGKGDFMNMESIGKYIKQQREKAGLSQAELGEKVHVTRQAVSSWENGKTSPDSDILLELSKIFGVTINDILCADNIEEVALKLVNENNKKRSKIKKLIVSFYTSLAILVISFLAFYFITNYNSIIIYKAAGSSDRFIINEGIIISTSKNTYFKFGDIIQKDKDININNIKLYYKENNKEHTIFKGDIENILSIGNYGYGELYKTRFKKIINDLYVDIIYNDDEKEVIKLELKEKYKNDLSVILEKNNILKSTTQIEKEQFKLQLACQEEKELYENSSKIRNDESSFMDHVQSVMSEVDKKEESTPSTSEEPPKDSDENLPAEDNKPTEEEQVPEEPKEEQINYDEIIKIIETYGMKMFGMYQLEYFLDDGTYVMITEFNGEIDLDVYTDITLEQWKYYVSKENAIDYYKFENMIVSEFKNIYLDFLSSEDREIINRMKNYLLLVYQEIK